MMRHLRIAHWDVQVAYNSLIAERNARLNLPAPAQVAPVQFSAQVQPAANTTTAPAQVAPVQSQAQVQPAATPTTPAADGNAAAAGAPEAYRLIDLMHFNPYNPEQERRQTSILLRDQVRALATNSATLTISQSVLLLQLAEWDIGQALGDWWGLEHALDRLHLAFDRMRSPEGDTPTPHKKDRARSERQDERLAILVSLTGRADWRSLQLFLMARQFDLVKAVEVWFRSGIPVAKKEKDKKLTRKDALQNLIPAPSDRDVVAPPVDNLWAAEQDFFRRVSDFSRDELVPLPPLHEDDREKRPFGSLLRPERNTIQAGSFYIDDHFVIEYFAKGKYWFSRFMKKSFKWPKFGRGRGVAAGSDSESEGAASGKVKFDFANRSHVRELNAWRRQQFGRITGVMRRKGSQKWEPIENALLHSLLKELHDKDSKTLPADQAGRPLKITNERLNNVSRFLNEAFVGTKPGNASATRGERTPTSVGTQMRRFFPIVRDFNIKADDAWFSKNRKISTVEYKDQQIKDLAAGMDQVKNWNPANERPTIDEQTSDSELEQYDDKIVVGDDEATKERKRHESRSEKRPIKLAKESAAAARAAQAERDAAGTADDGEGPDVLNSLSGAGAGSDDEGDGEGDEAGGEDDDDAADNGGEKAGKEGKKRKRGD